MGTCTSERTGKSTFLTYNFSQMLNFLKVDIASSSSS